MPTATGSLTNQACDNPVSERNRVCPLMLVNEPGLRYPAGLTLSFHPYFDLFCIRIFFQRGCLLVAMEKPGP
jgi:hypothetical protein